jgi:hypothetical protein
MSVMREVCKGGVKSKLTERRVYVESRVTQTRAFRLKHVQVNVTFV